METVVKEGQKHITRCFTLAGLMLIIIGILLYTATFTPDACANSDGPTVALNLQNVIQWLFGAFATLALWTLRKIDRNQTTLFDKVAEHDKEIWQMKGELRSAGRKGGEL